MLKYLVCSAMTELHTLALKRNKRLLPQVDTVVNSSYDTTTTFSYI